MCGCVVAPAARTFDGPDKKAADKERKYKAAMKRQLRGLPGWLANVRLEEVDQFVPLAYEACRSWGQHAVDFFNFVKRCAGTEGTRAAELYHWSAMAFGGHWRRRMAVEIGRGRVACLRRSPVRCSSVLLELEMNSKSLLPLGSSLISAV